VLILTERKRSAKTPPFLNVPLRGRASKKKRYGACADINRAQAQRKNPTFFERATQGQSIEEEALQILIHQKTLKEREVEIAAMINMRFGWGTYDEMLEMRRSIRKERADQEHAKDESRRQIKNNMAILTLTVMIFGVLFGGIYLVASVT